MERTLGWLSKCLAILVRYEKKAVIASSIGLTFKVPSYAPLAPSWRPGASGHGFPNA